ncbi:hypothetical protein E2562_035648 [Oryza meyeriana var. granulata]|uniref:Leucine-rich repeat-containing N-terminal plant-type domain-containing protein n=1 Tax=Oryza meyeriana var. granulata TaxID=110450 RepID=A0A6G1FFX1_9ORYZ|nr:hypothetical protein E2562_035648 [Oryza meyeriana var. granulata]
MANSNLKFLTQCLLLLFSFVATTGAGHESSTDLSHKTSQYSSSYNPQPRDFPNDRLYRAYVVIQRFKSTITSDPKNITTTWVGHDICSNTAYLGFHCGTPRDKVLTVTASILNGYNLIAPRLQGFIDQLPDLALFHAASNDFGRDIPRLTGLDYLYDLRVDNNVEHPRLADGAFQGNGHAGCVTANINFKFNITTDPPKKGKWGWGMIPAVGASATNARALLLNHNSLSGPFPASVCNSKLSYLALAGNKLTGPIPPSISNLQDSLLEVLLLNNQLSGCLPQELGMLIKAAVIDASMNQLTGPIPSSFSCLTSVEQLNLGGNRLYGEIPDALCKLAAGPARRLANLTLSSNYFTSIGPACWPLIKDGVLNVKNNCIPGFANQRRPAECASFLSQPKTCRAASATHVACPAAPVNAAAAPVDRVYKDYSSYVTYATLHK